MFTSIHGKIMYNQGSSGFWPRGVEMRCNRILGGAKWHDPPGSKAYGKPVDPRLIICFLIRGIYLKWDLFV